MTNNSYVQLRMLDAVTYTETYVYVLYVTKYKQEWLLFANECKLRALLANKLFVADIFKSNTNKHGNFEPRTYLGYPLSLVIPPNTIYNQIEITTITKGDANATKGDSNAAKGLANGAKLKIFSQKNDNTTSTSDAVDKKELKLFSLEEITTMEKIYQDKAKNCDCLDFDCIRDCNNAMHALKNEDVSSLINYAFDVANSTGITTPKHVVGTFDSKNTFGSAFGGVNLTPIDLIKLDTNTIFSLLLK